MTRRPLPLRLVPARHLMAVVLVVRVANAGGQIDLL